MLKSMQDGYEANKLVNHQIVLTLGPTPQVLIDIGLPQLPITMTGRVVDKCFFDHGLTKGMLERTYRIIESPKALYKSPTTGCVAVSYEIKNSDPLIAAIHPNKQLGGRKDYFNNVASLYYKENNPEQRWKQQGLLLWERAGEVSK